MTTEFVNAYSTGLSVKPTDPHICLVTIGPRGGMRSAETLVPLEATKLGCRIFEAAEKLGAPEVQPVLILSTAHIRQKTAQLLDLQTDDVPVCFPKGLYGWWIVVPDHPYGAGCGDGSQEPSTCPSDLRIVLNYARDLGCSWVCLDQDGPVRSELPTYGW